VVDFLTRNSSGEKNYPINIEKGSDIITLVASYRKDRDKQRIANSYSYESA
jgi:hypothetical protein